MLVHYICPGVKEQEEQQKNSVLPLSILRLKTQEVRQVCRPKWKYKMWNYNIHSSQKKHFNWLYVENIYLTVSFSLFT